ncbi:hypothetical protein [Paenibacillus periandrae]|uniref:hypothetical protein n=1 Tax=Paenibacillus periandrae TaxID=1761741 RepID=UPI001F09FBCB|nr:hypothetical protein [Paenibacillus periandrae]
MADNSDLRRVIIASQNTNFAGKLKTFVEQSGYKVSEIVVLAEYLIETIEESYNNDEPIHALIITTDLAHKLNDERLEFLSDCLVTIRTRHSQIKMVVLSNEREGHPFLAELVSVGIYNIFLKSSSNDSINVREILNCFDTPKEFAEVSKYREYSSDILWRKMNRGAVEFTLKTEKTKQEKKLEQNTEDHSAGSESHEGKISTEKQSTLTTEKPKQPSREFHIDDNIEDYEIPFPNIVEKIVVRDRFYGSVVVAVIGIKSGTGATHCSVSIANYLARKGNKVALVECNESSDFNYIELLYKGVRDEWSNLGTKSFKIDGVNYFKSDNSNLDLISLLSSEYTFIVMDLGSYGQTTYFTEFLRSNIQIVVASGIEWKQRHIFDFLSKTSEYEQQSKWNIILPLADNQTITDIERDLEMDRIFSLPYHPDPFRRNEEAEKVFENIISRTSIPTMKPIKNKNIKFLVISLLLLSFILVGLLIIQNLWV